MRHGNIAAEFRRSLAARYPGIVMAPEAQALAARWLQVKSRQRATAAGSVSACLPG